MFRRLIFVGILPVLTPKILERAALGLVVSLIFMSIYRELMPFQVEFANTLAHTGQMLM